MTSETIKDLEKTRHGYLGLKVAIYSFAAIGCCVLVGLSLASLVTGQFFFALDMGALCYWLLSVSTTKIEDIPRVPPVREQIAALPSQEILVRASDQTPAARDELLRAAYKATGIRPRELLRPETTPTEERLQ